MSDYAKDQNTSQSMQLFINVIKTAAEKIMFWAEVARQRHQLQSLTDEMLDDIGIDRIQARLEWERPFWDIDVPRRGSSDRSGYSAPNQFTSFRESSLT